MAPQLAATLRRIVGEDHITEDPDRLAGLSSDVFRRAGSDFALVCAPGTVIELAAVVGEATAAGHAVVPRGGGLSYTGGYLPESGPAVGIDLTRLDRIERIDATNAFVVVECGCTWKALHDALAVHRLRTPYMGPLSGSMATVGGALAQNAIYFASTAYGTSSESVLGLEVVRADGITVRTGSWAQRHNAMPFTRNWGPDLTGLFLGDCGALGIKARACLRLIPVAEHNGQLSFAYASAGAMLTAMSAVARTGLASECYGHDPALTHLVRGGAESRHSLNIGFEAHGPAALAEAREHLAALAGADGEAIDAEPVRATRHAPFGPIVSGDVVAPDGFRVMPVNVAVPHSRAAEAEAAIRTLLDAHSAIAATHRISTSLAYFAVGTSAVVIDVLLRWYDEPPQTPQTYGAWTHDREPGPATAAVATLREALSTALTKRGATNIQIGRAYPYCGSMEPSSWDLLSSIKAALDPVGLINPGVLGLPRSSLRRPH